MSTCAVSEKDSITLHVVQDPNSQHGVNCQLVAAEPDELDSFSSNLLRTSITTVDRDLIFALTDAVSLLTCCATSSVWWQSSWL
jgi:hypothetical protein